MIPPTVLEAAKTVTTVPASNADAVGNDEVSPDDDTTPMAVILGDKSPSQQPAAASAEHEADGGEPGASPVKRIRGPFEPPEMPEPDEDRGTPSAGMPAGAAVSLGKASMSDEARASVWSPAAAKIAQIKDLYLTAEAIGKDALDKNFDLVSDRQRQLIREYFDQVAATQPDA
jgi:hypothetical protein